MSRYESGAGCPRRALLRLPPGAGPLLLRWAGERRRLHAPAVLVACGCALGMSLVGCGPSSPFEMVDIRGKVTYDDGSLIPADRLVVKFDPVQVQKAGKAATTTGHAEVDPKEGTFSRVTTWKPGDGVVAGTHKVIVLAFRRLPNGIDEPNGAVPVAYTRPSTTPLEFEITRRGETYLEIQVEKPGKKGGMR